ncbi:MAG: hypothetical protein ACM3QS_17940 [Bacteroidota bacterium]
MKSQEETPKEPPEVKAALIGRNAGILIAVIGLLGGLLIAFVNPLASKWVNRPAPTADPAALAVEEIPQLVFAYGGTAEGQAGSAVMNLRYAGTPPRPHYFLRFDIPAGQIGYAGMAFQFDGGQNLSGFRAVEFTINFDQPDTLIEFYLKDIAGGFSTVRIVGAAAGEMELHYELANFKHSDLNALKEAGFLADDYFSSGPHSITVHELRFVR